jgi:phage tail tape-measure protein
VKNRLCLLAGLALAFWAAPVPVDAQGVVRGAQEGAARGNRAAGPVGGAVGGAVGGVVGGVAGGVKGVLGIPQETRPLRRAKRSKAPRRARADRS